jgi:hypothetical protein
MISSNKSNSNNLLNVQYEWTESGVRLRGNVPARVTQAEAAELLGVTCNDMRALKAKKKLMPCGCSPNKRRRQYNTAYYSTCRIVRCMNDDNWMDDAQHSISTYNEENRGNNKSKSKEG